MLAGGQEKELKTQYEDCLYPQLGLCHICISHSKVSGYPRFVREGKRQLISRYIYGKHKGDPPKGMLVLHHCDNKSCINPAHLYAGTYKDNTADMLRRNRTNNRKGEKNNNAKLTESDVKEIRSDNKHSQRMLGRMYGVEKSTIASIKNDKTWKHIIN
ncbi:unnamed protein product [marine sediment metagenome]|uniref:HNH nuclease domain-containing protein n=1 Tax=marine sediment metagenome TaxID=412755 RepID=X0SH09_9ZZZZ